MGTSLSLAVFAALVAAITVVAAMTVVGAMALMYYSSVPPESETLEEDRTDIFPDRSFDTGGYGMSSLQNAGLAGMAGGPTQVNTRRLSPVFEEDESSLAPGLTPLGPPFGSRALGAQRSPALANAAFGTPEWTEEEGATEIFSAHNIGDLSEFAFVDEDPSSPAAAIRQR
jgi:hypothetical protein